MAASPKRGDRPSLRRMFLTVALAVTVPFLVLTALLAYDRITADRAGVLQGLLGRAGGIGAEVERHLGARLAVITGAAAAVAASPAVVEVQARWNELAPGTTASASVPSHCSTSEQ